MPDERSVAACEVCQPSSGTLTYRCGTAHAWEGAAGNDPEPRTSGLSLLRKKKLNSVVSVFIGARKRPAHES